MTAIYKHYTEFTNKYFQTNNILKIWDFLQRRDLIFYMNSFNIELVTWPYLQDLWRN